MEINLVAICVLYKSNQDFFQNLQSILKQVSTIILVDNGCDEEIQKKIKWYLKEHPTRIYYIKEEENVGLALAQNHAIDYSKKFSPQYLVFFDDDSSPNENMVEYLKKYADGNPDVGIVAPDILHLSGGLQKYWVKGGYFWQRRTFQAEERVLREVNTVISSGSLIPTRVIAELGGMRKDFFIDYIDIEFCLRVRTAGYKISVVRDAKLSHSLGERQTIQKFGLSISPTHHSAFRKYYMTRNRVLTWKLYALKLNSWFMIDLMNFFFDLSRMIFLEKDKKNKILSVLRGFRDGIFMNKNPFPERI